MAKLLRRAGLVIRWNAGVAFQKIVFFFHLKERGIIRLNDFNDPSVPHLRDSSPRQGSRKRTHSGFLTLRMPGNVNYTGILNKNLNTAKSIGAFNSQPSPARAGLIQTTSI